MEYLVKTYTNPGEVVLDFAMGSGTTGAACIKLGRGFIGVEKDETIFDAACRRLEKETKEQSYNLFSFSAKAKAVQVALPL